MTAARRRAIRRFANNLPMLVGVALTLALAVALVFATVDLGSRFARVHTERLMSSL